MLPAHVRSNLEHCSNPSLHKNYELNMASYHPGEYLMRIKNIADVLLCDICLN